MESFHLRNSGMAGVQENNCWNCNVRKPCLHIANLSPALCQQCIGAFFATACGVPVRREGDIPIEFTASRDLGNYDPRVVEIARVLHDFAKIPGQRPWDALVTSERLEKLKLFDTFMPMVKIYLQ